MIERDRLILENAGLVRMMAHRLHDGQTDLEDLIQWGQIGLILAADRFDPEYGTRFSTYAVPYIAGEIRRCLRENKALKCSRELSRTCTAIHHFQQDYEEKNGRAPSIEELCQSLHLSRENALLALCASQHPASLDEPISQDEELSLVDTIADTTLGPAIEDHLDLTASIHTLAAIDQNIIQLRYYQNKTQTQTAKLLGLSQVQVCRMEKRILKALRQKII